MSFDSFLSKIGLNEFIALDLETSGLDSSKDKIIELSAYKFINGKPTESFTHLIDPKIKINKVITKITGITNDMLIGQKTFDQIENDFTIFIGDMPIVGHNILFDLAFLSKNVENYKSLFENRSVCDTYYLSKIYYYFTNSFSLSSLCELKKITVSESHRAEQDAKNSGLLFLSILKDLMQYSDKSLIQKFLSCIKSHDVPNKNLFQNILKYYEFEATIIKKDSKVYKHSNFYIDSKSTSEYKPEYSIDDIFKKNGIINSSLDSYETRNNQINFCEDIYKTLNSNSSLIADAGAGLGKSYAYIFASLLFLSKTKKQVVISTNTHTLQNQLFYKDIPFALEALNMDCKVAIIKGMNNYICLSRFYDLLENIDIFLNNSEVLEILPIIMWLENTSSGDISECNGFNIRYYNYIWSMINSRSDYCTTFRCNQYNGCYYKKIRDLSSSSNILIVNHSMLVSYYDKYDTFINDDSVCIIDECHNFHSICQKQLSTTLDINLFKDQKKNFISIVDSIKREKSDISIANSVTSIKNKYSEFINLFESLCIDFHQFNSTENIQSEYTQNIMFSEKNNLINFRDSIVYLINKYDGVIKEVLNFKDLLDVNNFKKNSLQAINLLLKSLENIAMILDGLNEDNRDKIHWFSFRNMNRNLDKMSFNSAPSNLQGISKDIFEKFSSMILCSATLCTDSGFDFFVRQMGLKDQVYSDIIKLKKYPSPYYYSDQSKLFIINSSLELNLQAHIKRVTEDILDISRRTNKRILVLCTSFKQIYEFESCINLSIDRNDRFLYQKKGVSKNILISEYLKNKSAVLFGTNTFWEGVDFPNDKLEILILFKLPFANPKDPYVDANIKYYESRNMDPFSKYQLEDTILKLKQGFGRLIRSYSDMGVCIITDPRIAKRKYGQYIVDSLPVEPTYYSSSGILVEEISNFLK